MRILFICIIALVGMDLAWGLSGSSRWSIGFSLMNNPQVTYNNFKLDNRSIGTIGEIISNYNNVYGISSNYYKFSRDSFYSLGIDSFLPSSGDNDDGDSIKPVIFIWNIGLLNALDSGGHLKLFLGLGFGSFGYEEDGYNTLAAPLGLFQTGLGYIYKDIVVDMTLRSLAGTIEVEGYSADLNRNAKLTSDYATIEFVLKIGRLF